MADAINDDEFLKEKAVSDQDFMNEKPAQQPVDITDPVNEAIAQRSGAGKVLSVAQGNWFTRPFQAAGIAIKSAVMDGGRPGLSDESIKNLQDLGILDDYKSQYGMGRKLVTGAVLLPGAAVLDSAMRAVNAGLTGAAALAGGFINEAEGTLGQGRESPEKVAREAAEYTSNPAILGEMSMLHVSTGVTETGAAAERAAPTMKDALAMPVKTVEGAAALEAPMLKPPVKNDMIDAKSGNLNLDYIKEDANAKELLANTAQAYADENGVVISHAKTIEQSQEYLDNAMKETGNGIPEDLSEYMHGDPVNRPMLYTARQLTVQSTRDAIAAVQKAVQSGTPADAQAAMDADDNLMAMTGIRLESHKIPVGDGTGATNAAGDADIEAAAEKLAGMTQEERIRIMSTFDSPEAIARFARDIKKPTWGEMGLFYVINNYLSGPITHTAYAASWAVQSVIRAGLETPVAATVGRIQGMLGKTLKPEEVLSLQNERQSIADRFALADKDPAQRLKARESVKMTARVKEIDTTLSHGITVMPGEAAARFYGIGQGAVDSIRAAGRALRTGQIQMLPGEAAAAKQAAKEAADAAIQEGKSAAEAQKAGEAAYNKAAVYSNNPIVDRASFMREGPAKKLVEAAGITVGVPTRVIAGIHSLQKFSGYSESMNALAYRKAVSEGLTDSADIGARIAQLKNDMPPDMIKQAAEEAKYAALMGKPGKLGQNIENLAHTNAFTRLVVPFSRVVTNLGNQKFLERTPLGFLWKDVRDDLMGENGNAAQANAIAKMTTGSTLMMGGAWLAAQGINNGQGSDKPNEKAFEYLSGKPPYTVRIGNWNVAHRMFGVAAGSLSLGADLHDIFKNWQVNDEDAWGIIGSTIHVLGNDMLQENALKGAADLYDAIRTHRDDEAKRYVLNAVGAAVTPYSVGMNQTTRMIDPLMRSTIGNDFWDRFKKQEMAHLPFTSDSLYPQVDIFGRPMQRGGDYQAAMQDPVMQNLDRLGVYPPKVPAAFGKTKLTDQQYFDYATKAGALFYHQAQQLVAQPQWANLDPKTQFEMLHQAQKDARADARGYMCMAYPDISKSCARYISDLSDNQE
jgi:hypothetical protein